MSLVLKIVWKDGHARCLLQSTLNVTALIHQGFKALETAFRAFKASHLVTRSSIGPSICRFTVDLYLIAERRLQTVSTAITIHISL